MKGIVFTEFLEMVENEFGDHTLEEIIEKSDLKSGGAYTSVGTYDHLEMVQLVSNLSEITKVPVGALLQAYGKYFFKVLVDSYGSMINRFNNSFELFEEVESHIHVEVRKIYPDAELPTFETTSYNNRLEMIYTSSRKLSDFAYGLIQGGLAHFREKAIIKKELLTEDGSKVKFTLSK